MGNILEDLNSSLEKESRRRFEPSHRNLQRKQSLERVKSLAVIGQQASFRRNLGEIPLVQIAPFMKTEVIEDLRRVAQGQGVSSVNENRKRMVMEKYEKARTTGFVNKKRL